VNAFYIANHRSHLLTAVEVGELVKLPPRPNNFLTKKDFLDWSHNETTRHCFYNLCEPKLPGTRLTKDNPATLVHGLVVDLDARYDDLLTRNCLEKLSPDYPVAWVSSTFSGGLRVVWLFEKPIPAFDPEILKRVLVKLTGDMRLKKIFPGFDDKSLDPSQYFELGTNWRKVTDGRISSHLTSAILFDVAGRADVLDKGPQIPVDDVAAEVERRWPGRWKGPFVVGAQGVRFWDDKADAENAAWIRETGVYAFTGECRFLPWADVLGQDFVRKYEQNRIGAAIDGIYYDGQRYWARNLENNWVDNNGEVTRRHLIASGLAKDVRRGQQMSEVDRGLFTIESQARVDGAFPFLYVNKDTVTVAGRRYLNVSRVRPVAPAMGVHYWGDGFPWIARYLDQIFNDEQRAYFLSWLSHFYQSACQNNLRKGQALFVAGTVGIGKTFLSARIVGDLLGGSAEATNFLLGKTEFNSSMFEAPLWTVDDAQAAGEGRAHELYTQIIKKVIANFAHTYRRMYSNPVTLPWTGRVLVTLNSDAESISMLPNIELSILDKTMFLKAEPTNVKFAGAEAKVAGELPAFGAYLRDYVIPEDIVGDYRFGVRSYHNPELLQIARNSSQTASFLEILTEWRANYFATFSGAEWTGNPTNLLSELLQTESLKPLVVRDIKSSNHLGKLLSKIIAEGSVQWLHKGRSNQNRFYVIKSP
jgi:hypothetical protein